MENDTNAFGISSGKRDELGAIPSSLMYRIE